jgi:hypothetical protein
MDYSSGLMVQSKAPEATVSPLWHRISEMEPEQGAVNFPGKCSVRDFWPQLSN